MKNFLHKAFSIATVLATAFGPFAALVPSASAASFVNTAVPSNTSLTSGLVLQYSFDNTTDTIKTI